MGDHFEVRFHSTRVPAPYTPEQLVRKTEARIYVNGEYEKPVASGVVMQNVKDQDCRELAQERALEEAFEQSEFPALADKDVRLRIWAEFYSLNDRRAALIGVGQELVVARLRGQV